MLCRVFGFLWLFFHLELHSQSSNYTGMGAFSMNQRDAFSFLVQPAALARGQDLGVGMFAEHRYMIRELSQAGVVFTLPSRSGCFGITAGSQSGSFRQQESSLSYGMTTGARVHLGTRFFWNNKKAAGYNRSNEVGAGLGMNIFLTENLQAGFYTCSAFSRSRFVFSYRFGLGYDLSQIVHLSIQIIKENFFPAGMIGGIHYQLAKNMWIRGGINTSISGWWLGTGFNISNLRIDIINNYHPQLGLSPALTIYYHLKNSNS